MKITTLGIYGGGIRLISYFGMYWELCKQAEMNITNIAGLSSGSLMCLYIICGYKNEEFKEILLAYDQKYLIDINLKTAYKNGSITEGKNLKIFINSILSNKGFRINITLKELYDLTGIDFYISVYNVSYMRPELFNYKTNPLLKVTDAVYMSCSFPSIFPPMSYNNSIYIDGGVYHTDILEKFDVKPENKCSLYSLEMPQEYKNPLALHEIFTRVIMMYCREKINIYEDGRCNLIHTLKFEGMDFDQSNDKMIEIFDDARNITIEYFDTLDKKNDKNNEEKEEKDTTDMNKSCESNA